MTPYPLLALVVSLSASPVRPAASAPHGGAAVFDQGATAECGTWQECRQQALEAADRHDYETFHDLSWRAVQKGPRNDADLMRMLARAQSLSGRPGDALVMLDRLAGLGVSTNAATSDDFERVRALPGWAEFERKLAGLPPAPAPPLSPRHPRPWQLRLSRRRLSPSPVARPRRSGSRPMRSRRPGWPTIGSRTASSLAIMTHGSSPSWTKRLNEWRTWRARSRRVWV